MSGKASNFTAGDALTGLVVALFVNPMGWAIIIFSMVMVYRCAPVAPSSCENAKATPQSLDASRTKH